MRYFITIIAALLALFLSGCMNEKKQETIPKPTPLNVEVIEAHKQTLPIWMTFVGKTQGNKTVDVVARVKGRLESMHFRPGDIVTKGDILFSIEKDDYLAELKRQEARLEQDRAGLELAKNDVARYRPLVEKELATREKLDQLMAKQKQAEAMVEADNAAIKQAKLDLEYTTVRARISGKIGRNLIDEGNMVGTSSENSKLATIVNYDPMYAYFHPSNERVQTMIKFRSNEQMPVKLTQPKSNFQNQPLYYEGVVDFIDNTTDLTTGTITMRASVKNSDYTLFPGAYVDVNVFLSDRIEVMAVKPTNVYENQLGSYLYIVDENDTVRIAQIATAFSNKEMSILQKDALKEGTRIIVSGAQKLREGMKVSPQKAEPIIWSELSEGK